jgi:tRNA (guanine-N7-)-methyltransferase
MSEPPIHRPIRSYVLRQGRMSAAQRRCYESLSPEFLLPYAQAFIDLPVVFGRVAPIVLEIGCGMGETTALIAQAHPHIDYLGVEVHAPGVGSLLKQISEHRLTNLRIVRHDAVDVVHHMLRENSLDGVHIFFPDPWPKKRHHKRRLIQGKFVGLLASRLKLGGYLHLATDWWDYAEQMLTVLNEEPLLKNTAQQFALRGNDRPLTKFEQRGLQLGHGVWDLIFRRKG